MTYLPLLTIPLLFLLVAITKPQLKKILPWNICAVCAAVSLSWIILLGFIWAGLLNDLVPVAILMGMSVTGLMFKIVAVYEKRRLRHLWAARLIMVMGGFATIVFLLRGNLGEFLLSVVITLLLLVIVSFLLQGTTHADAIEAMSVARKSITKKLDNCC